MNGQETKSGGFSLKKLFNRRAAAGSWSAAAAVIVIVMAVVVNLIAGSLPLSLTQIDLTADAIYSLSDQTKRVAAALEKDVALYLIANTGSEDSTVLRLLNNYAALSEHITAETVDPGLQPTFLKGYELETNMLYQNSVLVDCGGRYRLVGYDEIYVTEYVADDYSYYGYSTTTSFDGENALTNAIHYVSSDNLPKVYVLSGHGEGELSEEFTELAERDNLETESLSLLSAESVPEDAAAVLIPAPSKDLGEDETELLISYLQGGGSVVLMTGYIEEGKMPNLLKLTESMGLTVQSGVIIEGDRSMRVSRYPHYILPSITSHEITDPLISGGYYILTPIAQPLAETENSTADITWLLTTSSQAYAKAAAMEMTTTEKEEGDTDGPFHVGALSENGGTLLWITSSSLLDTNVDYTVAGANSNLILNALNSMGGQEETISIRARSLEENTLTVPESSSAFWSVTMIGLIPVFLTACGLIIYVRRKRR